MDGSLPSGVVTLLFTDIEGSTKLLQRLGDDYGATLAEHRRILRDAFDAHGGAEVDTQGDAFLVAFARATDAVAAATEAQRALAATPIRVRMGIHTGEPLRSAEGYVGLDLHRGARIAAAGHGGQVLLSESTRALVGTPVRDLGRHRLKDLSQPEHLYQLEIEGLSGDFPLLRTLEAGRSNLPASTTSFVGREAELALVDRHLDDSDCRLLTLVGPGGAGKTRLSVEAARRRLQRYPHGVYLVPLAAVADPELLASTIALAIGLTIDTQNGPGRTPKVQLENYLAERAMLLVLDNFEHLLDGAVVAAGIIEAAPDVDVVVTSRERLGLSAEWVIEVPGLQDAAEQLFAERARRADAAFRLDDTNIEDVRRICRAVEHMPLGIELAAASVSMLPPIELAAEIEKDLDVLNASARDVPERHRSLRAAFEGSWRLLTEPERKAFARLAVFRGTFSRDAAAAAAETPLAVLAALVDKSLVRRTDVGRFELHELLRQFAAEALLRDADASRAVRDRHAVHYAEFLNARAPQLVSPEMLTARDELRLDVGNILAAVEWAIGHWSEPEARAALRALDAFYMAHNWAEGAEVFDRMSETIRETRGSEAGRADGVLLRAQAIRVWRFAAVYAAERSNPIGLEALPELRAAGEPWDLAVCLLALGTNAVNGGEADDAVRWLDEARDMVVDREEPSLLCWIDLWLGWAHLERGDSVKARARFDEALEAAKATGSETNVAFALSKLGILADFERDYATGLRCHLEAHHAFERVGDPAGVGYAMSRASLSTYALGDYEASKRFGRAGFEAFTTMNHRWGVVVSGCRVGFAAMGLGDLTEAHRCFVDALATASDRKLRYLVLYALAGIAAVLVRQGELGRAVTILSCVLDDPAMLSQYRPVAADELKAVEPMLTPDELAAAREAASSATADALAAEWLPQPDLIRT